MVSHELLMFTKGAETSIEGRCEDTLMDLANWTGQPSSLAEGPFHTPQVH